MSFTQKIVLLLLYVRAYWMLICWRTTGVEWFRQRGLVLTQKGESAAKRFEGERSVR